MKLWGAISSCLEALGIEEPKADSTGARYEIVVTAPGFFGVFYSEEEPINISIHRSSYLIKTTEGEHLTFHDCSIIVRDIHYKEYVQANITELE